MRVLKHFLSLYAFSFTSIFASEAELVLPELAGQTFLGVTGHNLLLAGLVICFLGIGLGIWQSTILKNLPVHKSMREISELIYETCKTYLLTQGKFLAILWSFIAAVMIVYFGYLRDFTFVQVSIITFFSIVGILGSYAVAWFGIRINTYANSRTAFAALKGKPFPAYSIPLAAGMSIGMLLISVELAIMLAILLF